MTKWLENPRTIGDALRLATNIPAAILAGYYGGSYLDRRFGTEPWLMFILVVLGVATGLKMLWAYMIKHS